VAHLVELDIAASMDSRRDVTGKHVAVGTLVRVVRLHESGLRGLEDDERARALSMVGETFEVEEIDEYGRPTIWKRFPGDSDDSVTFHSIALDPHEFEAIGG
jgi:hypothetical protein